jgi:hypothetical protein
MFDNTRFWTENKTFEPDEIAGAPPSLHGFPNRNGRHARMMADLLTEKLGDGEHQLQVLHLRPSAWLHPLWRLARRSCATTLRLRWLRKAREATGVSPKSLIRTFGPRGDPQAKNLFNVIATCRSGGCVCA